MSPQPSTVHLETGLRYRFLLCSIGLAIVVSAIFITVAFRLSKDLGESLEVEYSQNQMAVIGPKIKSIIATKSGDAREDKLALHGGIKSIADVIDKEVIYLDIWLGEQRINIKDSKIFLQNELIKKSIDTYQANSGFMVLEHGRVFWAYRYDDEFNCALLLVRRVYALDLALGYAANRLSITAFLTFWLAIWAALIMSALVSKRFEKSNLKLSYLASHDSLTKLPNRNYLHNAIRTYIADMGDKKSLNSSDKRKHNASLLMIDLDKFKDINDTMGHNAGDSLLKIIAEKLTKLAGKQGCVARYGGDEFVVWCEKLDQEAALILAERMLVAFQQPILIDGSQFEVSVSIGISCYPQDGKLLDELFKHSDIAMYHAKRLRLGVQTYQQELDLRSAMRVNLRGQLNQALNQQQFVLYYQPKVNIADGQIIGVEALIRWQHPSEGLLAPDMFISIIEQSAFIHEFTRYVIKQAISQCRLWLEHDLSLSVAVNLSPYNLMDPELIPFLKAQLVFYNVPPNLIEIELTENATMVGIEATKRVFDQLKEVGVKLSIDDFGTGMSSLAYIKQLHVDYIKIDRSFITNLTSDLRDEAVIMSILVLCQKLEREVIVEGVETKAQAEKLIALGCRIGQGYYFAKPMPVYGIMQFLKNNSASKVIRM